MNISQTYVLVSIIALALIAIVLILLGKKEPKPLSKLAALAFVFIIAGVFFGDDRLISYSLMGAGVVLAVVDIIRKKRS
jgi:uncharacterized membrane protein